MNDLDALKELSRFIFITCPEVEDKNNQELSELLIEEIWADYDLDSRESAILTEAAIRLEDSDDAAYKRIRKLEKALDVALDTWRDYSDSSRSGHSFIARAGDTEAGRWQVFKSLLEREGEER